MSKSLGIGLNPVEALDEYGADATRYGLLKMASSQDVRFSTGPIEEGRKLTIKLWNVARLLLQTGGADEVDVRPKALEERWILARIESTRERLEELLARFDFTHAVDELYHLTFDDFCDWYAEAIKPRLREGDPDAAATALAALERLLKLLHPVLPHVTEEIWSHLPARGSRLIVSAWPEPLEARVEAGALERVQAAATTFRRSGVLPAKLDDDERRIFDAVVRPERARGNGNVEAERARLRQEIERAEGKLANERFVAKAPSEVVEAEREKLDRYRRDLDALAD